GQTFAVAPERMIRLLRTAGFETRSWDREAANSLLWGKLCVNCGINALTGLLLVENGKLLEINGVRDIMVAATEECARVARAKGIDLPYRNPAARVLDVARSTAGNKSSMYQDILRGTPTECEAIYGSVVREAKVQGVDTPVNRILWAGISALVKRNGEKGENADRE
ncbi:MAG: ketopantoate reductase C-terminal domain-containing protein, partial [Acidobacteriota bacterium]